MLFWNLICNTCNKLRVFFLHTPDVYDARVRMFARELRTVMVSVDYRLAPEHLYPAQLDDAFAALRHLMLNAKQWGVDPNRIAVMGELSPAAPTFHSMAVFCTVHGVQ